MDWVAKAPAEVTLHSRNPARNVAVGGNQVGFCTVAGPPNISDIETGRRAGTLQDFSDLMRLAQSFDVMHMLGPVVEPLDVAPGLRHLDSTLAMTTLTDRIPFVFCRGTDAVADALGNDPHRPRCRPGYLHAGA